VAALCGAAAIVGLVDSATAPDALAVPDPFPATIEPITETPSDSLLLPYFETDLNAPPPAEAPAPSPPQNGLPFLPPLPTLPFPTFFPFPPG
jgi:hypothetical protein